MTATTDKSGYRIAPGDRVVVLSPGKARRPGTVTALFGPKVRVRADDGGCLTKPTTLVRKSWAA